MITQLKESLWNQFGACIDMLRNAIELCPEELLQSNKRIFYTIYHTLIFLDYYSSFPPKNFISPLPFTIKPEHEIPEEAPMILSLTDTTQKASCWIICRQVMKDAGELSTILPKKV